MFKIIKKEINWGGRPLTIETGKIARQADGAVVVSYGETVVLCTAVAQKEAKEGVDFFPLTVNYQEKAFAAGKIPGGFFKREGRPSEKETLTSRLIDRPIRPLFPEGFYNETQVICTVISHDLENDPDIVSIVGTSAALAISGIPFEGPIGGARVGYKGGKFLLNPLPEDLEESELDLVVAGTKSSVLMVESQAKTLPEKTMLEAVEYGHKEMQAVIKLIEELKDEAGKETWEIEKKDYSSLEKQIKDAGEKPLREAYKEQEKQARQNKLSAARDAVIEQIEEKLGEDEFDGVLVNKLIKNLEKDIVRGDILKSKKRIDGRGEKDVRDITSEVKLLPKTHGSALFTRGETQALAVTTLGTGQDMQIVDALEGESKEKFLLHYNFPPFSVGEASFLRGPGRREIGHGKLAYRALKAVLPDDEFPYTIRVVSEVTESNGSSSMATVCSSSLSMMDAGVPLKAPVAGIAMGLIKEGKEYSVLSDIMGDEDHLGDMDFKVAGTEEGITALQMDIKINGITTEIMKTALEQAHEGRKHILSKMAETLTNARENISDTAPQIETIKIDKEKIGEVIGPGGKVIRDICEKTEAKIDIEEDGTVLVSGIGREKIQKAIAMIKDITAEVEMGKIYEGDVVRVVDFGAFVNFLGKNEGLVHISEIKSERINTVTDVINEGDTVKVKVIGSDRGKVRLSMKRVDQNTGEDLSDQFDEPEQPRGRSGGGRDRGRGGDRDRRGGGRDRDRGARDNKRSDKEDSGEKKKKRRFF